MGWPPPKTLMGFQQVSEAEKHHATMNLSEPEPKHSTCHQEAARAYHPPYTTPPSPIENKICCHPQHKTSLFERKKVSAIYFAQAGLARTSPQSNLSFPWSHSTAHLKPAARRSRRRTSVFWVGCFNPLIFKAWCIAHLPFFSPDVMLLHRVAKICFLRASYDFGCLAVNIKGVAEP